MSAVTLGGRIDAGRTFDVRTLEVGRWYCIGFKVVDGRTGEERDDFGRILKLDSIEGDARPSGVWVDEDGELVESVFDPELQLDCSPDGADFFVVQS